MITSTSVTVKMSLDDAKKALATAAATFAPAGDLDEPCDECGADAGERCRRTCPTRND